MAIDITPEIIGIFIIFIIALFILSRIVKVILHAVAIAGAGFSFPWILQYLGIETGIVADVATGLQFAALAVGAYLIYQMFELVKAILKLLFVPIKILFGTGTGKSEIKRVKNELAKIKKK